MSELTDDRPLPCPFCGHEAVHQNHSARPGEYWYANSFIRCPNCKASGPIGSQDEAVTAWNRRAAASTSTEGADNDFAEFEGVPAKELADTVARYGKALRDIDNRATIPHADGSIGAFNSDDHRTDLRWIADRARAALTPPASKVTTQERNA